VIVVLLALGGTAWIVLRTTGDRAAARRGDAAREAADRPEPDVPAPESPPPVDDEPPPGGAGGDGDGDASPERPMRAVGGREVSDTGDPEHASLRVLVVDPAARAIEGAAVSLTLSIDGVGRTGPRKKTDAAGRAFFAELRAEEVIAVNVRAGSFSRSASIRLTSGKVTEIRIPMPGGEGGFPVRGTIRDVDTGPIPHVSVTLSRTGESGFRDYAHGFTDEDGAYAIESVPPGTYRMTISGGASSTTVTVTKDGAGRSVRARGRRIEYHERKQGEVEVATPVVKDIVLGKIAIEGTVRDGATGALLPGVTVQLQSPHFANTATDRQGRFRVTSMPPGAYTILLKKAGYVLKFKRDVKLRENEVARVDFTIDPAANLEILLRDPAGEPVTGEHWVRFDKEDNKGWSSNLPADADGRIVSKVMPLGPVKIRIDGNGWSGSPVEIEIRKGDNRVVVPVTREGGKGVRSLAGVVRNKESGKPVRGVRLRVRLGLWRTVFTDESGRFAFEDLRPASYTVYVDRYGYADATIRGVQVEKGKVTKIGIELEPAATIHLRVTDAAGSPVSGKVMLAYAGGTPRVGRGLHLELDEDGRATFARLPPGFYSMTVYVEGRGRGSVKEEIEPGENNLAVALAGQTR